MRIGPKEQAVLDQLTEDEIPLSDLARRLRGWHFKDIQNAASSLVRKGLVEHRTDPRDGIVLKRAPIENRPDAVSPKPRFKIGDRVRRDDGSQRGKVSFGPSYDSLVGWKWKVQATDGTRWWWNETSMVADGVRGDSDLSDMDVANTIREQIGGRALQMLGARDLVGDDNSLTFKIGRNAQGVTHVRVQLDPSDTYTVQFVKVGRAPYFHRAVVSEASDIYVDQLRKLIEEKTGLYTSL